MSSKAERRWWSGLQDLCREHRVKETHKSPVFLLAVALWVLTYPRWIEPNWWDVVIEVVPSMLGFTLGGIAVLLSLSGREFLELLAKPGSGGNSYLNSINAAFTWFVAVQFSGLIVALVASSWYRPTPYWLQQIPGIPHLVSSPLREIFWAFGGLLFLYSLLCGAFTGIRVYTTIRFYSKALAKSAEKRAAENLQPAEKVSPEEAPGGKG